MPKPKPKAEEAAKPTAKYKLTISLDPPLARRFASYCGAVGRDQSDVASEAFRAKLEGFYVGFRTAKGAVAPDLLADRPEGDGEAELRVAG